MSDRQKRWYGFDVEETPGKTSRRLWPALTPQRETMAIVGGTKGIGKALAQRFTEYDVSALGTKDYDCTDGKVHCPAVYESDVCIFSAVTSVNAMMWKVRASEPSGTAWVTTVMGLVNVLPSWLRFAKRRKSGTFIYLSSVLVDRYVSGTGVYAASKAFGERFVDQAAHETRQTGVYVHTLRLGYTTEGLTRTIDPEVRQRLVRDIPVGRWLDMDEVEKAVRYLIGNEAAVGRPLNLTGGL